jgi:hemoglobin
MNEPDVYAAIGEDGFARLADAFYAQVPGDDILGPMYRGRNLEAAKRRLQDFLVFRFGGPTRYIDARGHPRLRLRHAPFPIDAVARDRWLVLMHHALDVTAVPPEADRLLRSFFQETSAFLINRPE